jgi:hypothetical protein
MRRPVYVAAIVAITVLMSGCATDAVPAATASSALPSATSAPPSPTASPSPTADGEDPADPSTWLVTADRIGPLRLGMPIDDARSIAPEVEACHDRAFFFRSGAENMIYAQEDGALVQIYSDLSDGPRTPEGLGVGSTRADVLEAHPDAVFEPRNLGWLQSGPLLFGFAEGISSDGAGGQTDDRTPADLVVAIAVSSIGPLYEFCG